MKTAFSVILRDHTHQLAWFETLDAAVEFADRLERSAASILADMKTRGMVPDTQTAPVFQIIEWGEDGVPRRPSKG